MTLHEFHRQVGAWVLEVMGETPHARDPRIRAGRFLEEAIELVQAVGLTQADVVKMAAYVYARPVGEVRSEIGGSLTTLSALARVLGYDLEVAAILELQRMNTPEVKDRVRQKNASTVAGDILPGASRDDR